ncbi:MAG TPA: lysophospholipid acyltransferase family protein [Chloroflexia bacterium]|nr:lysophospholipid acyltransferase family protein [Chloroflexia bacterium]
MNAVETATEVAPKKNGLHVQQGDASRARLPLRLFRLVVKGLFCLAFRVRVRGLEKLPPGPAILCVNHLGWADPFLPLLFFPVEPRIYVVGEKEVAHISTFRNRVIDKLEIMVSLDRDKPREALETMQDVMRRGGSVLIFPEGKLGEEEGALHELKHGASHLSVVSGYPLVPVGLTGTQELWLRRKLTVRVGKPIYSSQADGDMRDKIRAGTATLDASMRTLLPGDHERARVKLLRRWLTKLL